MYDTKKEQKRRYLHAKRRRVQAWRGRRRWGGAWGGCKWCGGRAGAQGMPAGEAALKCLLMEGADGGWKGHGRTMAFELGFATGS